MLAMRAQGWLAKLTLLGISLSISLAGAEVVSRFIQPIYMTERISLDGRAVDDWLEPGAVYYQRSSEYESLTTITQRGYRAPSATGDPDVIFLGDSFTFGWGLADDQTFASRYCRKTGRSCVNLGAPGTGTTLQVERLRHFLDEFGWRPREVKLFVLAMTASFSAGNDLADNYNLSRSRADARGAPAPRQPRGSDPGPLERLLSLRTALEAHSNLVRLVKYYWGPFLKSLLVPEFGARLADALALTKAALNELDAMSRQYDFSYSIYLLHPVQDIRRGTHVDTVRELSAIAPLAIRPTAQLFSDHPERYFFALDGHPNVEGARRIADLLLAEEAEPELR